MRGVPFFKEKDMTRDELYQRLKALDEKNGTELSKGKTRAKKAVLEELIAVAESAAKELGSPGREHVCLAAPEVAEVPRELATGREVSTVDV